MVDLELLHIFAGRWSVAEVRIGPRETILVLHGNHDHDYSVSTSPILLFYTTTLHG